MWCSCTIKSIRNRFLPWSPHLSVEIREKMAIPGIEVVREMARSVRQVCNERPPPLLANRYLISQPLLSQPQLAPHKHETEVVSPQYTLHWHLQHLIPQNQIAAVSVPRLGQKKPQRMLPNPETRHWICQVKAEKRMRPSLPPLTDPFANPRTAAFCCASAAVGPEPWGTRAWASSRKNSRRDRSVRSWSTLERWLCMLLSQTGNTKNVCIPTR